MCNTAKREFTTNDLTDVSESFWQFNGTSRALLPSSNQKWQWEIHHFDRCFFWY
jgi:hypothetical protein